MQADTARQRLTSLRSLRDANAIRAPAIANARSGSQAALHAIVAREAAQGPATETNGCVPVHCLKCHGKCPGSAAPAGGAAAKVGVKARVKARGG